MVRVGGPYERAGPPALNVAGMVPRGGQSRSAQAALWVVAIRDDEAHEPPVLVVENVAG
jgi:hypothetical protein